MRYPIAEKFVAPQGEGLYTGTVMAFVRLVGCSVGQKVCTSCDTDFSAMHVNLGGGLFSAEELASWVESTGVRHVCLTGGEPMDRDLTHLLAALKGRVSRVHVETSGTVRPPWLLIVPLWVCVSPKPGWRDDMVHLADEVKVILGGLGDGPGWPTVEDALAWAKAGKLVYVQPRNDRLTIDADHMAEAIAVVTAHPALRLSAQLHKYIRTR